MKKISSLLLACAALALNLYAVETKFWQQTDQADFEKGSLHHLSLRSDGRLYLAPEFREVYDPSVPYLWALVSDGKGNLYAGGGGTGSGKAKLYSIDSTGKGKTLAELEGIEIHALALDRDGQIYAATNPDGKVYKVSPQGKAALFFDPHAKYIWALAFNSQGDLFVATGDKGEIYRVGRDGHGSVFFKTDETHARSLVVDSQDNLIVGTEPGGLILRVSTQGKGFVLYQTPKREVTAVAVGKAGEIFAAAIGNRSGAAPVVTTPAPAPVLPPVPPAAPSASAGRGSTPAPSFSPGSSGISGGSEVYRIGTDGAPRKIWSNSQDVVYAVGFDFAGHPLLGTGNRGKIYRLDSASLSTLLIETSPTQITSFAAGSDGRLYAGTGNIGRIYELGHAPVKQGAFESEVFDAGSFAFWGRLSLRGAPKTLSVLTRSGNLNRPEDNWSPWTPLVPEKTVDAVPCSRCLNGRIASPSARFLQYKVEMPAAAQGPPPEVASVEIAYLPKNVPPTLEEIEIGPPNYRFPAPSTPSASPSNPSTISLPALGQKRRSPSGVSLDLSSAQTLTWAKGMMGARWSAADENGDTLVYKVEIRGVGESGWRLLKDKVRDKYVTWDSTTFPDGDYELRVTASDLPGNIPSAALSSQLVSDPFLMDNTPPKILNLSVTPGGGRVEVRWNARDARSIVERAEYSVNGGEWITAEPKTKLSDSPEEEYAVTIDRTSGERTIAVRITDSYENQAVDQIVLK